MNAVTGSARWALAFLGAASLAATGCRQTEPRSSFAFVETSHLKAPPDETRKVKIEPKRTVFIDAVPIGTLATPTVPARSRAPSGRPVTITVRVFVDANGHVEHANRSVADFSLPTNRDGQLLEAINAAIAEWRFEPAMLAEIEPQADGLPVVISSVETSTAFDVAFTFGPTGKVKTDLRKRK